MKIRKGFVSNSSSSSFICDVCNHVEAGYDICLSEAEMSQCEKGHTFCNDHITVNITDKQKKQWVISQLNKNIAKTQESTYYTDERKVERVKNFQDRIAEVETEERDIEDELNDLEFNYYFPQEFCPECLRLKKEQDARENYSKDPQWQLYLELKEKFENL